MKIAYYKEYSHYLGCEVEFKIFGHAGTPVLALPCRGGRFYDWEDHGMIAAASYHIERGHLQVVCADSFDAESYLAQGDARTRALHAEQWFCYLTLELYPRILELCEAKAGSVIAAGTDLGAAHALRLWMRRPELFASAIALSGDYEGARYFGGEADDLVVRAGCAELVRSGVYQPTAKKVPAIMCCGRGAWEGDALPSTEMMAGLLNSAGARISTEIWSEEVTHHWYWWCKQFEMFAARLLGQLYEG